jgi:glutamate decarboxylase
MAMHSIAPAYTGRLFTAPVPALRLPEGSMDPEAAYRFIHDELMLDGSSRLNLATFVTTWMDPEAGRLMAETFDKNMIDKDEYPATAAIEQRSAPRAGGTARLRGIRQGDFRSGFSPWHYARRRLAHFWDNGGRGRYADFPETGRSRRSRGGPGCR